MDIRDFEALPLEEQEKIFHQSPFKEKGDLLLHSHDPLRLTRSLSQEELYLVTKEMDLEERSEVIRYASLPQLLFISDVDCWKRDRIDSVRFTNWLETLLKADESRFLAWFNEMDAESVITGFKKLIRVLKPHREYAVDEILGDTPYFTLDEMYFISVEEENMETVRRAIEVLFENQRGRYVALLEEIMSEMDDIIEEDAYQRREMRLAERGFPNAEDARKIYRPITREELESFPQKKIETRAGISKNDPAPHYPMVWNRERLFLDDLLLLFSDEDGVRESLQEELAWLSNKVIACEGIDFTSEEKVRQGIERARSFVNLGLQLLVGSDIDKGKKILETKWIEILFRWGSTHLMNLRSSAQKLIRNHAKEEQVEFLRLLNPPYEFIVAGLLRPIPEFYEDLISGPHYRDFQKIQDIDQSQIALDQLERIFEWLTKKNLYPFSYKVGKKDDFEETIFSLMATDFVKSVSALQEKGKIRQESLVLFVKKAFEENQSQRVIKASVKEEYLSENFSSQDKHLLTSLWALVFNHLEEELGRIDFNQSQIVPDYISILPLQVASRKIKNKSSKSSKNIKIRRSQK